MPGPHRVVDVVVDVGDDVGDPRHLPFDGRGAVLGRRADRQAVLALGVAGDAVADLPGQVQALPIALEHVDDAQALLVVVEAGRAQRLEHALAGVAERRVAQIVAEGDRLGQLLVQPQHLGDGAGDLRHLEGVRQARPVVIAGRREEHLRLVLQAAERLGVDDAVAIALERRPDRILGLGPEPALGGGAAGRLRRQDGGFALLEVVANRHDGTLASHGTADRPQLSASSRLVPAGRGSTPNHAASV